MSGKGLWSGLKSYVGALLTVVLFPLFWARSLRLARRHTDSDPRGPAKVGAAIVVSVLILAGGAYKLVDFQKDAKAGMYTSMDRRLSAATGESEYQDNVQTVASADIAIPIIERNLANATAAGDQAKQADLQAALNATRDSRAKAAAKVEALAPNHALYESIQDDVAAQDDQGIRDSIGNSGLAYPATMQHNADAAFAMKDRSVRDMTVVLWLFVWPSLFGAFFAPVVFALGSVLGKAFEPSDGVGFKPYPGAAAGFFLLFGAFGVPSVPFAAWVYLDTEKRSREGQIAL
jgi:hypothetical protein